LYTLALARSPEQGAMNELLEKKNLSLAARWRLAAAYLLTGKPEVAQRLVTGAGTSVGSYAELSGTYGSELRDKAMILEVMNMLNMKTKAAPLARDIAAGICRSGWLSTQTASYCLLSLSSYYGSMSASGIKAAWTLDRNDKASVMTGKPVSVISLDPKPGKSRNLQVINQGKGQLYARLVIRGVPALGDSSSAENGMKMSVRYTSLKGEALEPRRLVQGTSFLAEVNVRNTGLWGDYKNLALVQIFPSGWEISNSRISGMAAALTEASAFTYQDVRDDRVITYFDLPATVSKTFRVLLTATYQGRFRMPSVQCEAMYDNTINARVPGGWVTVSK